MKHENIPSYERAVSAIKKMREARPVKIFESSYLETLPEEEQAEAIRQAWEEPPSVEIQR